MKKPFLALLGMLAVVLTVAATLPANGYKPGDKAIDFSLKNVDGKMVSMADFEEAKGFILVFTCNHCPYAVKYEDRIIELDKQFKDKGYPVVAINPNDPKAYPVDSFEGMQERAKEKGFTFPYLFDETQEIARAYGAKKTPHVYVLEKGKRDKLFVRYIGAIDDNYKDAGAVKQTYVADAVEALLSGKEVEKETSAAVGCSIKWRDS